MPLSVDLVLGFVAGLSLKRPVWRFLAWPFIALSVALVSSFEMGNMALFAFAQLFPAGLVVGGVGILGGNLLRRAFRSQTERLNKSSRQKFATRVDPNMDKGTGH